MERLFEECFAVVVELAGSLVLLLVHKILQSNLYSDDELEGDLLEDDYFCTGKTAERVDSTLLLSLPVMVKRGPVRKKRVLLQHKTHHDWFSLEILHIFSKVSNGSLRVLFRFKGYIPCSVHNKLH